MIVVDTNVIAYALIPGERTEAALAVVERDPDWVAPRLWRSELRNVLSTMVRLGRLELAVAVETFAAAEELVADIEVEASTARCLEIAQAGGISAYDAEFVLAAELLGEPLVTGDRRIAEAFADRVILLEKAAPG